MCLCLCAQSYLWRPEISRYPEVVVTGDELANGCARK